MAQKLRDLLDEPINKLEKDMKIAYLDCFSGVSGDMLLGALIDLGLDLEVIKHHLASLDLGEFKLESQKVLRNNISATQLIITTCERDHPPRNLAHITKILNGSSLPKPVKQKVLNIFRDLAQVESKIHGCKVEDIHFHEVGAVDSIIDITGSVLGFHVLGINSLFVSRIPLGSGFVQCSHGPLPVPAPATLELLKNIPVYDSGIGQEMVTPTGAALVKHLARGFGQMPSMKIHEIGYGAGLREIEQRPNVVRIIVGEQTPAKQAKIDTVVVLEANLDDSNPEWLGYLMERLFQAGALDVSFVPLQMKKNRPGTKLEVIAPPSLKDELMEVIFEECSSLGIRYHFCERQTLPRTVEKITSPWGKMKTKKVTKPDGSSLYLPEYEECRRIAKKNNVSLRQIYDWVAGLNRNRLIETN